MVKVWWVYRPLFFAWESWRSGFCFSLSSFLPPSLPQHSCWAVCVSPNAAWGQIPLRPHIGPPWVFNALSCTPPHACLYTNVHSLSHGLNSHSSPLLPYWYLSSMLPQHRTDTSVIAFIVIPVSRRPSSQLVCKLFGLGTPTWLAISIHNLVSSVL